MKCYEVGIKYVKLVHLIQLRDKGTKHPYTEVTCGFLLFSSCLYNFIYALSKI